MRKLLLLIGASGLLLGNVACGQTFDVHISEFAFTPKTAQDSTGNKVGDQTDSVKWTNGGDFTHTSTSDQGFWDSGNLDPNGAGTYERDFQQAGTFHYHCSIHPKMKGIAKVGMVLFMTPPVEKGDTVSLEWSGFGTGAQIPPGTNMDVQVLRPGKDKYVTIFADQTGNNIGGDFVVTKNGTYKFRARLQDSTTQDASGWSPPNTLKIPKEA